MKNTFADIGNFYFLKGEPFCGLTEMDIFIPDNVKKLLTAIEKNGFEAYIVGGCVRDSILGKEPKDYDITTSASPEQVKKCLSDYKIIDTGIKHGTVTVVADNDYVEITTFRVDGNYSDYRRPDNVTFSENLLDDLSRRDFTINAMAYSHRTGIIDKFGGQKDLFRHKLKCVGEPAVRFNEDALRIMRAMRFAAVLDFEIEPVTAAAVHDMKNLLNRVAPERISKELDLLIMGKAPARVLIGFADVLSVVMPEIRPCIGFDQHSRYHAYDVWSHIAYAVEHSEVNRDVRLTLLLHDIAKPKCCKFDDEGNGHFQSHESESAEIAEIVLKRLRYPNDTVKRITRLIKYHYVTPVDDEAVIKHIMSKVGKDDFFMLCSVLKGDNSAKQSFCFNRVQVLDEMGKTAKNIIEREDCYSLEQMNVDGTDIISLGVSGNLIGNILSELLDNVISGKCENDKNKLIELAKKIISRKKK